MKRSIFPEHVESILRTLHGADFFSYGLLVGSWVFPVYHEYFGISYVLRTLDLDLAVDATSSLFF